MSRCTALALFSPGLICLVGVFVGGGKFENIDSSITVTPPPPGEYVPTAHAMNE
jgi:hypothetical protein